MSRYIEFIIRRRFLVLTLLMLVTIAFGYVSSKAIIASSIVNLFFSEQSEYKTYKELIREFANDEVFIIAFNDPDLLSEQSLKRLDNVVRTIRHIPDVSRVDSIINAQHVFARDDTLYIRKYGNEALEHPGKIKELLADYKSDPLYSGLFVSDDGRHSAVIVELEPDDDRPAERGPLLVREIIEILEQEGFKRSDLHTVGLIATVAEVMHQTHFNLSRIFPFVCIVLLLFVYIMFQRFWPVFITLTVSLTAVIWTFGFAVLLYRSISVFIGLVPAVILIVTTSDVIHLCSSYLLELAHGDSKQKAILNSGHEVGTACLMTSVTTFVGFVSMTMVPVRAFQQLGMVLGFGVGVALFIAMTLAPVLFSIMRTPAPWNGETSRIQNMLGKSLVSIEKLATGRPVLMVVLFAVLLAWSVAGIAQMRIETNFSERLDENNHIRIAEKYFNEHFAGANFLDVFIDTPEPGDLLEPDIFLKITAFQEKLEKLPEIHKTVSLIDLIRKIDSEFNPERKPLSPAHMTRQLLAQYILLFEISGGEDLDRLVDFDRQTLRVAVRMENNDIRATYERGRMIEKIGAEFFNNTVKVQATGMNFLMGMFVDDTVAGQARGTIFAFFCIMALMIIWMRSLLVGSWSMIPNILPLLALGGYVGWFWDTVDSDTLIVAMIAIGIGVDDTIHFLIRLKFEAARVSNTFDALKRSFHYSGRAIVITTLILVGGFAPFGVSDYYSVRMMGTLLPMTLVVALTADLFLVPALVRLGLIRFGS
ncbi:MAG: MMPL family transporter [Desulfobacteraceae bacterium]|nr:MMPL family transporter [Desulfobacteraceae bacterium]